ncbi:hypothetical protein VTK56DRAFT_7188 [Thermocarpiscus australiensis]
MNSTKYSTARAPGHEHIPIYPRGFIAVRIVQLVLAIIIMGLSAFSIYILPYDGNSYIIAVAVMTFITSIYHLVARFNAPGIFNYWAILGLDIFLVIMWLASFALLASRVAALWYYTGRYSSYYSYSSYSSYDTDYDDAYLIWLAVQAAAASLGGVAFVLYIIALAIHSIALHRHRAAGLHCMPGVLPPSIPGGPAPGVFGGPVQQQQAAAAAAAAAVPYNNSEKIPGAAAPLYQQYPQQPVPAYQQQQPPPPQPPQQQQAYYPEQGYPPQQQQQQQGFYPPQPSQSPVPTQG